MKITLRHAVPFLLAAAALATALGAGPAAPPSAAPAKPVYVDVRTTLGTFTLELWPDKAPVTVKNFLNYVAEGHFDGTIFHRVIRDFMIQGGGYTADLHQKPTHDPIPLEAKLPNLKYTVAMARTRDPNSATSQFFVNTKDNASLDPGGPTGAGYTVFGKVVRGTDVIDKIAATPTEARDQMFANLPTTTVTIEKVTLAK